MKKALFLALWLMLGSAWAQTSAQMFQIPGTKIYSNTAKWFTTKLAACTDAATRLSGVTYPLNTTYVFTGRVYSAAGAACSLEIRHTGNSSLAFTNGDSGTDAPLYTTAVRCLPDGATAPVNGVCAPPGPTCATGEKKEAAIYQGMKDPVTGGIVGGNYAFPTSIDGCMIRVTSLKSCVSKPDGQVFCTYRYTVNQPAPTGTNGVVSAGAPTGPLKEEIATGAAAGNGEGCPAGTVSIGVSGSGMIQCAGSGTNPPSAGVSSPTTVKPPVTTTNPDGSTSTKQDTVTTNKDGSTTTTTSQTTTLGDGTKTTSSSQTTGNATDGTSGVADAKTGADPNRADLCALHPELNICKNSTFSGACGEVSCTGDAIQCGILRAAAAKACEEKTDRDALTAAGYKVLGDKLLSGVDPSTGLPSKTNAAQVQMPGSLDAAGWLGGGACFPDKQLTVAGHTVNISFTKACEPLIAFRYALMIIALLVSFRMLSGTILKD